MPNPIQLEDKDVIRVLTTQLLPELTRNSVILPVNRNAVPLALFLAGMTSCGTTRNPSLASHILVDVLLDSRHRLQLMERWPERMLLAFADLTRMAMWQGVAPTFPWESPQTVENAIRQILLHVGEDPDREGLIETPTRVAKAWLEWGAGYRIDPASVFKSFEDGAVGMDQMVIVHNIPVISKCEHHLADITGIAHVGYIPAGKIVGLSKLARAVDLFARRLQVQERMTVQIADAIVEHLQPLGVGVLIRAAHACMSSRGVKIHGSTTTTSAMRGVLLTKDAARLEFLHLCRDAEVSHA